MTVPVSAIRTSRVAVFVDGENLPADHAAAILALAAEAGSADWLRVYGDAARMPQWQTMPGFRVVHSRTGKNSADMLIAIEAMERALTGACQSAILASSDGDFTHLALRLRELGVAVLGIGEAKAPVQFRLACTWFHEVPVTAVASRRAAPVKPAAVEVPATPTPLDRQIRVMIAANSLNGTGMKLGDLGVQMIRQHGVKIKNQKVSTWRQYLAGKPTLYALDPRGPEARVRYLPKAFDG